MSHLTEDLPVEEALQMLYVDSMGVVTHYAITKLYEVLIALSDKKPSSDVTIATTFYMLPAFSELKQIGDERLEVSASFYSTILVW